MTETETVSHLARVWAMPTRFLFAALLAHATLGPTLGGSLVALAATAWLLGVGTNTPDGMAPWLLGVAAILAPLAKAWVDDRRHSRTNDMAALRNEIVDLRCEIETLKGRIAADKGQAPPSTPPAGP